MASSVAGTSQGDTSRMSSRQPPDGRLLAGACPATATIGWLMQPGRRSRMPRCQSTSGGPGRQPDARNVQSLARSSRLSTYGWPSIISRSISAPDLPGAPSSGARSVARASSSDRPALWSPSVLGPGPRSGIGGLHLCEQLDRPAAAAQDGVVDDAVVANGEQVHVMSRVRHAVLLPAQRVLDQLSDPRDGEPVQLIEMRGVGEPPRVLSA